MTNAVTSSPSSHDHGAGLRMFEGPLPRRRRGRAVAFAEIPKPAEAKRPLRVARMLALAHRCAALIASGAAPDRAELARRLGLSRARMTQLLDLTLLAPDIQ